MQISREWAMPSGNTFTIPPIRDLVSRACREAHRRAGGEPVIIDPFANTSRFGTVTNDLNPEHGADFSMDALEFLKTRHTGEADLVLFDPPYSITQAAQLYNSYGKDKLEVSVANMGYWAACKDEMARITKLGGYVLTCGWNTNGLGLSRGFSMESILVVAHGGAKNDTLVTLERKTVNANKYAERLFEVSDGVR